MWLIWSLVGLACAVVYGFGIAYVNASFHLHPLGFVTLWMPGVIVGLTAVLWAAHSHGVYDLEMVREKYWYMLVLIPVAGLSVGVLMNVSIPYAIGGAPNAGYVFAIASCAAPIIGYLSVRFGIATHELTALNKIGLAALPLAVLMATYKS